MVPHCGFDLHFSDDEWCWASFHVFASHLCVFFGEMSIFSFLKSLHSVLHSGCTNLHSLNSIGGLPFLHTLSSIFLFVWWPLFDDGHSDWCEVIHHCSFDLHFSNNYQSFHVPLGPLNIFFEEVSIRSSAHVLIGLFGFFLYWAVWTVCVFWKLSPCQSHSLLVFFPILWIVFSSSLWFPLLCKNL